MCLTCHERMDGLEDSSDNGQGRRKSSRRLKSSFQEHDNDTYKMDGPDGNCQHTNAAAFQEVLDSVYFNKRQMKEKTLDQHCISCGTSVLED